jgi:hypothetical protein
MRIATGRVVDGKVEVEGDRLREGATVTVLAADDDETFELSADDEAALRRAIAEAERGEGADGDQLLDDLSH